MLFDYFFTKYSFIIYAQKIILRKGKLKMHDTDNDEGIFIEKQIRVPNFYMTYEHVHEFLEIFYLKTGVCTYTVNNVAYHLSAGDLFIVAPGDRHCTRYAGVVPCERYVVYCRPEALPEKYWDLHPEIMEHFTKSGKVAFEKKAQIKLDTLFGRMLEENNMPDEYSQECLFMQVTSLFIIAQRHGRFLYEQNKTISNKNSDADIENVLRYVAQNCAMPITLEEVSERTNLSPTYFSKKFRKVTGITFKNYLNNVRIRQACQMLLTTDDTITKIAVNCGFNSSNYFKDCFRRLNGVSPRDYRKHAKSQCNAAFNP